MALDDYILTFNKYVREKFEKRVVRISFDMEKECPWNRCVFCNHSSFVPFNAVVIGRDGWHEQFLKVKKYMAGRYKTDKFFAYFQNNTSTFGPEDFLFDQYQKASHLEDVVGLVVSTRPDYIDEKVVKLILSAVPENMDEIWIELGLQSVHEKSIGWLKRGHTAEQYFKAIEIIEKYGENRIKVAPHLIFGIPGESFDDYLHTIEESTKSPVVQGVKFHHLQVHKNTELEELYQREPFEFFSRDEYIRIIGDIISRQPEDLVFIRLFTTSPGDYLVAPKWNSTTQEMLQLLEKYLKENNIKQGSRRE